MKAYHSLPKGYQEIMQINLQKDKQTAKKVNIIASIVMVVLLVAGHLIIPIKELFNKEQFEASMLRLGVLFLAYFA